MYVADHGGHKAKQQGDSDLTTEGDSITAGESLQRRVKGAVVRRTATRPESAPIPVSSDRYSVVGCNAGRTLPPAGVVC